MTCKKMDVFSHDLLIFLHQPQQSALVFGLSTLTQQHHQLL